MTTEDRHMCHCGRGFVRKEHLRRHQASHEQPSFVCPICDRSFTRNDVLKRHVAVHNQDQAATARTWRACDACHENKTKCDGGEQCALCAKRGIDCTYRRDGWTAQEPSPEKEVGEGLMDIVPSCALAPTTVDSSAPPVGAQPMELSPPEEEIRTQPGYLPQNNDIELARAGLECISNAAGAAMTGKKHKPSSKAQPWLLTCKRTYFRAFHERWPIVHAPIFDERTDGTLFVTTVLMIGSWQNDDPSVRDLIFKLHERFMFYLLRKLIAEEVKPDEHWPFETYQISLLHLIFAFESGKSSLFPGARRLLVLLITALRSNGSLNPEIVESHESTHAPGTFGPWLFGHRTRWRRLMALTLKLDTYMALMSNQPPVLRTEELELGLPSTFALWNGYGIDIWHEREPQEPSWRADLSMAALLRGSAPDSGLLVEDIASGLCGSYSEIWKWSQFTRTNRSHTMSLDDHTLNRLLESWKMRLDGIANLWIEPQLKADEISDLLMANRGEEDVKDPGWETLVLTRIAVASLNTTMLYHLLTVHLEADVRSLSYLTLGSRSLGGGPAATQPLDAHPNLSHWALEYRARSSIVHSIYVLKAYENSLATMENVCQTMDPIAQIALCTGAIVMRGWFISTTCSCHADGMQMLDVNDMSSKNQWIEMNGSVSVDNVALCRCSSGPWMARFVSALTHGGQLWEMSGSVAECLRRPLDSGLEITA